MAYTDFTPLTRVQEAQDAQSIKIWDESTWNGEEGDTIQCDVIVKWYDDDDVLQECDPYQLIVGADTTRFDEYLTRDGHVIDIADLTKGGESIGDRFFEGMFIIETIYNNGDYAEGSEPYYSNFQAFLAKNWCMIRKLPATINWPMSDSDYRRNRDIFLLRMYMLSAEDAVDLGKKNEFRRLMSLIRNLFNNYNVEECF